MSNQVLNKFICLRLSSSINSIKNSNKTSLFVSHFKLKSNHNFQLKSFISLSSTKQTLITNKLNNESNATTEIKTKPINKVSPAVFKCSIDDPRQHNQNHLSKFYRLDSTELATLDPFKDSLNRDFYLHCKAFNETCLMIREPAVEIINYLKNLDLSLPTYRFVLYGNQNGTGKRSTLFHLLHYCYKDDWLLIHLPHCSSALRRAKESQPSTYKEGRLDTPIDATLFLKRFSIQNNKLLKKLDLKTTKKYNWSNRESSKEGTPLLDLIDYANTRIKYSSDICGAIIREIKLQAKEAKVKVFVCIDEMNSYFGPTRLKRIDKSEITPDDITIIRNFKKLLKNDWTNGVVMGSVSNTGVIIPAPNRRTKFYDTSINIAQKRRVECTLHYEGPLTPIKLLNKEGFYFLEPFIPIQIPSYNDRELMNQYEYFKDRNWLQNPESLTDQGREELVFLSGKNPYEFMRVCQSI